MRNLGPHASLSAASTALPQLVPFEANPSSSGIRKTLRGQFLPLPRGFPLSCKIPRRWWPRLMAPARRRDGDGLCFHSTQPLPVGTAIELEIPLRRGSERFAGTVVLIRELSDGFEIGVALAPGDSERAALVVRICELEFRLRMNEPARAAEARRRAAEWATLKPRLEKIPSLQPLLFLAGHTGLR
jgi:hypothetical protein